METIIKDPALNLELQELHFIGERWLDDLANAEDEGIRLLKFMPDPDLAEAFDGGFHDRAVLRRNIDIFMNKVSVLMVCDDKGCDLKLIDDFFDLQTTVASVISALNAIKFTLTGRTQAA